MWREAIFLYFKSHSSWKHQKTTSWTVWLTIYLKRRNLKPLQVGIFSRWLMKESSVHYSLQIYGPSNENQVFDLMNIHMWCLYWFWQIAIISLIPLIFLQSSRRNGLSRKEKMCELWLTGSELELKLTGSSVFPGNKHLYLASLSVVGWPREAASPDAGEGSNENQIGVYVRKKRYQTIFSTPSRISLYLSREIDTLINRNVIWSR